MSAKPRAPKKPPRPRNTRQQPPSPRPPPPSARPAARRKKAGYRPSWLEIAGGLVGLTALIAAVFVWWLGRYGRSRENARTTIVDVGDGSDLDAIAAKLEAGGLVPGASTFASYLAHELDGQAVRPGRHLLLGDLSKDEIVACLVRAPSRRKAKITFPEGHNRFDMSRRLEEKGIVPAAEFLVATQDQALLRELQIPMPSAEGYVFPATYELPIDSEAADVVRRGKGELDRRLAAIRARHPDFPGARAAELGWGLPEILTLASMVEREAAVADERALVAAAFYNRFTDPTFTPKPPRLQSDPTAGYGCLVQPQLAACAGYAGKITPEMNQDPQNGWSTYAHAGLPPTPIDNPGEATIEAAIAPANTNALYFVARGGGRHAFAATLAEHNENVKRLRELRAKPATTP